jgi:hypothetical protein
LNVELCGSPLSLNTNSLFNFTQIPLQLQKSFVINGSTEMEEAIGLLSNFVGYINDEQPAVQLSYRDCT